MKKIITLLIAASTSSSFAYLSTYDGTFNTLSDGSATVLSFADDAADAVTGGSTDFSLGTDIWSPESAGVVDSFSFTNAEGTTHTFGGVSGTTITAVHVFGLANDFTIDAGGVGFSIVSGWDIELLADGLVNRNTSLNAVGSASGSAIGNGGNEAQGHGTIVFDSAVSSFTLTESNGTADTVTIQFEASAVPEPSSTALLGLGGLAFILRRRR